MTDDIQLLELNLHPNEASGLTAITDRGVLDDHGWDVAFWAVLDECHAGDCVALIGHRRDADDVDDAGGWQIERLRTTVAGDDGAAEDAEAVARWAGPPADHDGAGDVHVYVFGSQFGGKDGPLQRKRAFVARFREADVRPSVGTPVELVLVRTELTLHRLVNDALRASGLDVIELRDATRDALIVATRQRAELADLVRPDDVPINVEGAGFRRDGSLLLGLRFPTAADGRPILVDVTGVERLFSPGAGDPEVRGFWIVGAVGRNGAMAGVRDLELIDEELHLVTGNIDSKQKGSVLLTDYPEGRDTVATHWRARLPTGGRGGSVDAVALREFPDLPRIEGIAADRAGRFFYVSDEDEGVRLRFTRLLAER